MIRRGCACFQQVIYPPKLKPPVVVTLASLYADKTVESIASLYPHWPCELVPVKKFITDPDVIEVLNKALRADPSINKRCPFWVDENELNKKKLGFPKTGINPIEVQTQQRIFLYHVSQLRGISRLVELLMQAQNPSALRQEPKPMAKEDMFEMKWDFRDLLSSEEKARLVRPPTQVQRVYGRREGWEEADEALYPSLVEVANSLGLKEPLWIKRSCLPLGIFPAGAPIEVKYKEPKRFYHATQIEWNLPGMRVLGVSHSLTSNLMKKMLKGANYLATSNKHHVLWTSEKPFNFPTKCWFRREEVEEGSERKIPELSVRQAHENRVTKLTMATVKIVQPLFGPACPFEPKTLDMIDFMCPIEEKMKQKVDAGTHLAIFTADDEWKCHQLEDCCVPMHPHTTIPIGAKLSKKGISHAFPVVGNACAGLYIEYLAAQRLGFTAAKPVKHFPITKNMVEEVNQEIILEESPGQIEEGQKCVFTSIVRRGPMRGSLQLLPRIRDEQLPDSEDEADDEKEVQPNTTNLEDDEENNGMQPTTNDEVDESNDVDDAEKDYDDGNDVEDNDGSKLENIDAVEIQKSGRVSEERATTVLSCEDDQQAQDEEEEESAKIDAEEEEELEGIDGREGACGLVWEEVINKSYITKSDKINYVFGEEDVCVDEDAIKGIESMLEDKFGIVSSAKKQQQQQKEKSNSSNNLDGPEDRARAAAQKQFAQQFGEANEDKKKSVAQMFNEKVVRQTKQFTYDDGEGVRAIVVQEKCEVYNAAQLALAPSCEREQQKFFNRETAEAA